MNNTICTARRALYFLGAGVLAITNEPALAQQDRRATSIEEIIVTAQKREQSLQQTTVSMTALSGNMLEDAGLPDLNSIENMVPNLNFRVGSDGGSSTLQAFIRGVGQFDFDITTDPGVGLYIDGVYIARTIGANMEFADIHQVQVLRGPQGTLYGKNTIGGAINVVTRTPTGDTDASLEATYGSDNYIGFKGYAEFPLGETVAGSVSLLNKSSDGWQSRVGDDAGDDDMTGARIHLNWTPTDTFASHLVVDGVDQNQNVYPRVLERFNPNEFFPFLYNTFVSPTDPCCTANADIDQSNVLNKYDRDDLTQYGASWTNDWDLHDFAIKSITGYRNTDSEIYRDSDNDPKDYFSVGVDIDHDQFSQEFVFSGLALEDKLDWVAGLYYFGEDGDHMTDVTIASGLYEALSPLPLDITLPDGTPIAYLAVPLDLTLHYDLTQKTTSYAAYLHGIYSLTDRLRMTLALRYTDEEKKLSMFTLKRASQTPIVLPGATDAGACDDVVARGNGSYYQCKESWDEFSPKLGLDYDFTADLMGYMQVSSGFRSGAFNGRPLSTSEISVADPETLLSYEAGFKSEWLDKRLVVNGAVFYNDYKDQQFLVNRSSASLGGGLALIVDNAAESTAVGGELEFTFIPVEGLTLSGGVGYIDAEFDEFETINPATGQLEDLSDREFQDTPQWTFNLGAQYEWLLPGAGSLRVLGNAFFKDDVYYTNDKVAADYELLHPDGYTIYDAGIIYATPGERWEIALHGRNLSDEREINGGFTVDAFGSTDVSYTAPRRYYLSVKYQL